MGNRCRNNRITIKNFQCHEYVSIELGRGVNTITGGSSAGKSAIIKSLKWLYLNKPAGTNHIKHGHKECIVSDGYLTHHRGKEHYYKLGNSKYKAIGRDVPIDVLDYHNINELNFIDQHNTHYFINLSPAERSKLLNKLCGYQNVNKYLDNAKDFIRENKVKIKLTAQECDELKSELQDKEWMPHAYRTKQLVDRLESECEKITQLRNTATYILSVKMAIDSIVIPDISQLKLDIKNLNKLSKRINLLNYIIELKNRKIDIPDISNLKKLVKDLDDMNIKLRLVQDIVTRKHIFIEIPDTAPLKKNAEEAVTCRKKIKLAKKISAMVKLYEKCMVSLIMNKNRLDDVKRELKICPICGGKL